MTRMVAKVGAVWYAFACVSSTAPIPVSAVKIWAMNMPTNPIATACVIQVAFERHHRGQDDVLPHLELGCAEYAPDIEQASVYMGYAIPDPSPPQGRTRRAQ